MKLTHKLYFILAGIFCFTKINYAQPLPNMVYLDTAITNTQVQKSFYVRNPSNKVLQITAIRTLTQKFYFGINTLNINPFDSALVTVNFKTNQNVTYRDFLIFENNTLKYPIVYYALASAKYPETIYAFSQGLYDEALKTAIRTYTSTGYVTLGYNIARDNMFATIDKYLTNDTIECVYTGRRIRAVNRTEAQNQGFNTEHTFPQSFFGGIDPMVSDIYHLYPTDNAPNNARGNYDFGIVVSNITYENGGSKLGQNSSGAIVFEPRDVHKGNVARSLFYFCVKYNAVSPGGFMDSLQEHVLRQWNVFDTVDNNEHLRNDRIAALVHVRNPFIDHPELIDRIKSTFAIANTTPAPKVSAAPFNVVYDTLASNDTSSYYIALMNYGKEALTVNSVISNIPQFIVDSFPVSVPASELKYIKVKFHPTSPNQTYNGLLTVQNTDSIITVNLRGFSNSLSGVNTISNEIPSRYALYQNYPNPFNPITKIKFDIPLLNPPLAKGGRGGVSLKIFNILGKEVATLVNENLQPGSYEVSFNGVNLSSGIYFYKLTSGDPGGSGQVFSDIKRAVLIK
jgi:hypothetical protein